MSLKTFVFRSEPLGSVFNNFLKFTTRNCESFSVVWVEGGPLRLSRNHLAKELHPFMVNEQLLSHWREFQTTECLYRCTGNSAEILRQAPGLYLWNEPTWPRDLKIYTRSSCWLKTNTQNQWGLIYADVLPIQNIVGEIPGIDLELNKPALSIDGSRVGTLDEFFNEVSRSLIPQAAWGRNLNAFNDILHGGFGTPEYGFVLIWRNSEQSRQRLGEGIFSELIGIIEGHEQIELTLE